MIDIAKLKGKISDKGLNIPKLAEIIGVDRATLYRKIQGNGKNLSVKDATEISKALSLSAEEVTDIFFTDTVT